MHEEKAVKSTLESLSSRVPRLAPLEADIGRACDILISAFRDGRKLLVCGNGGSAADADHIVGELMKGFISRRPLSPDIKAALAAADPELGPRMAESLQLALPAIALTQHAALITAFSNDVDPAMIFAQQVLGYGRPGDVLWAISTSGNSKNVVYAAAAARALGLKVIGLTGLGGGALSRFADVSLAVPEKETYKVQELHLPLYHAVCMAVEGALFP